MIVKTVLDNKQFRLTAVVKNGAGTVLPDAQPSWSADIPTKVQLVPDPDNTGDNKVCLVKTIPGQNTGAGVVRITATAGTASDQCALTIQFSAPASVVLTAGPDEPLA